MMQVSHCHLLGLVVAVVFAIAAVEMALVPSAAVEVVAVCQVVIHRPVEFVPPQLVFEVVLVAAVAAVAVVVVPLAASGVAGAETEVVQQIPVAFVHMGPANGLSS